jgi:hypothetical protein
VSEERLIRNMVTAFNNCFQHFRFLTARENSVIGEHNAVSGLSLQTC